jgi:hypothetical protein
MLPAWLENLVTPCPPHLRALGYLREVINLRARRARCDLAWQPHLERSRAVLREAAAGCPRRRRAVILGSGLLNDVPLGELAAAFGEVVLVDVVQPLTARWQRRRFANVRAVTADVTGTAEGVYRVARVAGAKLPRAEPTLFRDDPEVDLVASVNLLSQLPSMPAAYLARAGVHPRAEIDAYARDLVRAHLDWLRRLPGTVALLTDVEVLTVDRAGRVVEAKSALHGVELPWEGESWIWNLAPRLEIDRRYSFRRRVVGIPDVKQAPPRPGPRPA